ncbi:uncharacterized protein GGS22DRAFT_150070 [Annulohypoxylon maeteangense]|uniref:uncharacterized protein n=1 Tax=Annulohypoxylon maeteangense TaxID=1927788 RepID=UPI00200757FC|nr:uncharacterized protein GGS22DRAFT_150070 [Annulohypoxylon maeteangense]KAI0890129.1 hypothetical protein GGS22DRAFT_150070 [Annulohypoxylon maeteangense]
MTTQDQSNETARCFGLVLLSVFILPFSASLACTFHILGGIFSPEESGAVLRTKNSSRPQKIILVTGVGMAKGLALARSFYLSGYRVIGADFEDLDSPCPGRYSQSLSAFYSLPNTDNDKATDAYNTRLVGIIQAERVTIWVSCSGVANALQDAYAKESIERHTACKCIQFDVQTTSSLHNKGAFMEQCKDRGLPVPETHEVKSNQDITQILAASRISNPERKFILKSIGLDDVNRGNMTLLPLPTERDTKLYLSKLPISKPNPWILQQFIPGGEEYCTHSLVVRGEVKCFVACPSAELLMHYTPLPSNSPLSRAMLDFTVEFVRRSPNPENMTGHLSFDFMTSEKGSSYCGIEKNIYAIECNPRAHTAVVLFAQHSPEMKAMVNAYLDAIDESESQAGTEGLVVPPANIKPRYWIGHDLVSLLIHPMLLWCFGLIDFNHASSDTIEFLRHLLTWKEGTFEVWDPLPAFFLYHVYWPSVILYAWCYGRHWSRINVSTKKMFTC